MIINCQSCSKKFIVKNTDIPNEGRMVQCGYCSAKWHQTPTSVPIKRIKQTSVKKTVEKVSQDLSVESIKASDGKTYRFLGAQWAVLLPSGKTGLFAKRKIGQELNKLTGRKTESLVEKRKKKIKKEIDPSSERLSIDKKLPDIYEPKQGLGFLGYIFLLIIIIFSIIGILRTFEDDILNYFPEMEYIFELLDKQLKFFTESVKNMIVIINDLIGSY